MCNIHIRLPYCLTTASIFCTATMSSNQTEERPFFVGGFMDNVSEIRAILHRQSAHVVEALHKEFDRDFMVLHERLNRWGALALAQVVTEPASKRERNAITKFKELLDQIDDEDLFCLLHCLYHFEVNIGFKRIHECVGREAKERYRAWTMSCSGGYGAVNPEYPGERYLGEHYMHIWE